jgi:hypothetical protein
MKMAFHSSVKQDRPGHSGSRIWVPAFVDNKKLDPKVIMIIPDYFYLL